MSEQKRIRLTVAYDGTNYHGWQIQPNGITIESELNRCLTDLFREPIEVIGASRTDSGVHADGQVIHFDAETSIPVDKIPYAVNTELPDDISMLYCEVTDDDFNARFSAKRKTYKYSLYSSPHRLPTLGRTTPISSVLSTLRI